MCKHAVKKLPDVIRYVADQYNTQQMHDKAVLKKYVIKQLIIFLKH